MKITKYLGIAALLTLGACESDVDTYFVDGLKASTLSATENDLVLLAENSSQVAIIFTYNNQSQLTVYGPAAAGIAKGSMPIYSLEFSLSENFDNEYIEKPESEIIQYTVNQLNTIANGLGAKIGIATPMYVRLNTQLSSNTDGIYSDVVKLNVTTYKVDYTFAKMYCEPNGNSNYGDAYDTELRLYALDNNGDGEPDNKGVYEGFFGVQGWYHWYLVENDGIYWGNIGVDGSTFVATNSNSGESMWNFWYPGNTGCYYTVANTNTKEWTATYISSLTASGDVTGDFTYVRNENRWMLSFTTTTDNQKFKINGVTALYNQKTSTDDANAINGTCSIGATDNNKFSWNGSGDFVVEKAGEYTINLYMSDFSNLKYEIKAGKEEIEASAPAQLYMLGLNDVWDFSTPATMPLIDADKWNYFGVYGYNVCSWGYYFGTENGNWDDVYSAGETEGSLVLSTGSITPAEASGVFIWNVDIKNLNFTTTAVTSVAYTGFNNNWDLVAMTQATTDPTIFYSKVTINGASDWGGQIVLNDNWDLKIGGNEGILDFDRNNMKNITDDATLTAGDYYLIVNFANSTYKFSTEAFNDEKEPETEKEELNLYIVGLNDNWAFTQKLDIINETDSTLRGVYGVASCPYGYYFTPLNDWVNYYKAGSSDGALAAKAAAGDNITFESTGVYIWDVDIKNLTYSTTPVSKVSYTGFNDDWALVDMTVDSSDPTIFTAQITINSASQWGGQIILNDNWDFKLGGADGVLNFNDATNIKDDATLAAGTYSLTVNFTNGTYTFSAIE